MMSRSSKMNIQNEDYLPIYSKNLCIAADEQLCDVDSASIDRLRRFLAYRLAVDYGLEHEMSDAEKPDPHNYCHFKGLTKQYTKLLARNLCGRHKIRWAKQALVRDIVQPASYLGLTSDVTEFLLCSIRVTTQRCGDNISAFNRKFLRKHLIAFLCRLSIDFGYTIDAVVKDPSLRHAMKEKCLHIHTRYFHWMLCPDLINFKAARTPIVPSFVGADRPPGDWPNVAKILQEAFRPCALAMPPYESQGYVITLTTFRMWMFDPHVHTKKTPKPEIRRRLPLAFDARHRSGEISCAGYYMLNPDGLDDDVERDLTGLESEKVSRKTKLGRVWRRLVGGEKDVLSAVLSGKDWR